MDHRNETYRADSGVGSAYFIPGRSSSRYRKNSSEGQAGLSASTSATGAYPDETNPLSINDRDETNSGYWRPRRVRSRSLWRRRYTVEDSSSDSSSDWETISDSSSMRYDSDESSPKPVVKFPASEKKPFLQKSHGASLQALREQLCSGPENPYPYRELETNKRSLRLLILLPGSFHAEICCQLVHTVFDEPGFHEYEALSYTWGEPVKTHAIWIGTYMFPVGANLHHALKYIRREQLPRFLWVDAICINQENINERNHQVKQMTSIYCEASRIIIWLGTTDPHSDEALEFLPVLQELRSSRGDRGLSGRMASKMNISLQAMAALCRRPWWYRVWIIQEVACAKSEVLVQCGGAQWPWHAFVQGAQLMIEQREGLNLYNAQMPPALFPTDVINNITKLDDIRSSTKRKGMNLLELLEVSRGCQATDKRDHVYGVLGLAHSECIRGFETDYAKSEYQVCLDIAQHLIQTRNDLSHFGSRQGDTDGSLPSWVTDWSTPYQGNQILRHGAPYRAAKASKASFKFLSNPTLLAVQGVTVGVVRRICNSRHLDLFPWDKFIEDRTTTSRLLPWDKWVERRARIAQTPPHRKSKQLESETQLPITNYIELYSSQELKLYSTNQNRPDYTSNKAAFVEAYWRTLIGDSTRDGEFPAPASYGRIFEALHVKHEIDAENEAFTLGGAADKLASIVRECYPDSSREEWVSRLVALRNSSQKALQEEEFQREKAMRMQYLAEDTHVSYYTDEYPRSNSPHVSTDETTSQYGSQGQHSDDELWFTEEDDTPHFAARPPVPLAPEVPLAPKHIGQVPFAPEVPWAPKYIGAFTWEYGDRMRQVTRNRNLFYTSEGYLGLAPDGARDGDKICVLLGCNTPVVLREKNDETYELVGAGYLHGFMQGEALDMLERGEKQLEDFVLS